LDVFLYDQSPSGTRSHLDLNRPFLWPQQPRADLQKVQIQHLT